MAKFDTEWDSPLDDHQIEALEQSDIDVPEEEQRVKKVKSHRRKARQIAMATGVTAGILSLIGGVLIGYGLGYMKGEAKAKMEATVEVTPLPESGGVSSETVRETEETELEMTDEMLYEDAIAELKLFFAGSKSALDMEVQGLKDALVNCDIKMMDLAGFYSGASTAEAPAYALADLDEDGVNEIILKTASVDGKAGVSGVITIKNKKLIFAGLPDVQTILNKLGVGYGFVYENGMYYVDGKMWYKIKFDYSNSTDCAWVAYAFDGISFTEAPECYVVPGLNGVNAYHMEHPLTLQESTKRPMVDADLEPMALEGSSTGEQRVDALIGKDEMTWTMFFEPEKSLESTEQTAAPESEAAEPVEAVNQAAEPESVPAAEGEE